MTLQRLVETVLSIPEDRAFLARLLPPDMSAEVLWGNLPYRFVHALYFEDSAPDHVLAVATTGEMVPGPRFTFLRYLHSKAPASFIATAFVLDSFFASCQPDGVFKPDIMDHSFRPDGIADALLHDTAGILMWTCQMERLVRVFVDDQDLVAELRKAINRKLPGAIETLAAFGMDDGRSLADVVEERMIFGGVHQPRFSGARKLFERRSVLAVIGERQ